MEKIGFRTIWDKSKVQWKANLGVLFKFALVLSVLTLFVSIVSMYDLNIRGFDFFQNTIANTYIPNSLYVVVLGYVISFFKFVIGTIFLIYLFHLITHKKRTFSEDFEILVDKFIPLILMTIILAIPLFILVFLWFYFYFLTPYFLLSIAFLMLILTYVLLSEYFMFFTYAILFRNKLYEDSYVYSYELVKDNYGRTLLLGFYFLFKTILILLGIALLWLILGFLSVITRSEVIYIIGDFLMNLLLLTFSYLFVIFSLNYFLALEKEKGYSKDFDKK